MTTIVIQNRAWGLIPGSRRNLYGQIGLRLIDDLTGRGPLGRFRSRLEISDGLGGWLRTDINPVTTASGVLVYPELEGHRAVVIGQPARKYRVQIEAEFYRPLYRTTAEGIEFDVFPYNDDHEPQFLNQQQATDVELVPATNYPFPSHVPVIRGVVRDAGKPVVDAEVSQGLVERVVTDERGCFSLPVRGKPEHVPFTIDAVDHHPTPDKQGSIFVTLPNDVGKNQTINII